MKNIKINILNKLIKQAQIKSLVDEANDLVNLDSSDQGDGDKFHEALINLIKIEGIDF